MITATKLTDRQVETLKLIADGKVYQVKFGYGAWRIQGGHPQIVGKLISLGMAKWGEFNPNRIDCHTTTLGKEHAGSI